MKTTQPEMIEGPEAWARFTAAMKGVIAVPKEVVQAKIEEHRKESLKNPNRRGPKRKATCSASRDPRA